MGGSVSLVVASLVASVVASVVAWVVASVVASVVGSVGFSPPGCSPRTLNMAARAMRMMRIGRMSFSRLFCLGWFLPSSAVCGAGSTSSFASSAGVSSLVF